MQETLNQHHYTCIYFTNGRDAVEYVQRYQPEIVISDVLMPSMDGYEVTREIKKSANIPVVLLTELSSPEDILKGIEAGADNFLIKPVDKDLLLTRIRYILVNSELRKGKMTDLHFELFFAEKKYQLNSDRLQILDLLLSTYEISYKQKTELEIMNQKLTEAMEKVKLLQGLLPICAQCKKIRDDEGYWNQVEEYIEKHSEAEFTHSICRECMKKYYEDFS